MKTLTAVMSGLLAGLVVVAHPAALADGVVIDSPGARRAPGDLTIEKSDAVAVDRRRVAISLDRVSIDYRVVNTSGRAVVSDMAFRVPDYAYDEAISDFVAIGDVRLWVGPGRVPVRSVARALLSNGKDVTGEVRGAGLSVEDLGGQFITVKPEGSWSPLGSRSPIPALPEAVRRRLRKIGILNDSDLPMWWVRSEYRWQQAFATEAVHVRVSYVPASQFVWKGWEEDVARRTCLADSIVKRLESEERAATLVSVQISGKATIEMRPPDNAYVGLCWKGRSVFSEGGSVSVEQPSGSVEDVTVAFFVTNG